MERQFHPETWADVVAGLIGGRLRIAQRAARSPFCFTKLRVDEIELKGFLESLPARALPEATILPCTTAGILLGVPSAVVGEAIQIGLLKGEHAGRKAARIPLVELARFSEHFMMGSEGKRRIGKDFKFSRQMRGAGFAPVAVLKNHCIWSRSEAEQFLDNRGDINFCLGGSGPRRWSSADRRPILPT